MGLLPTPALGVTLKPFTGLAIRTAFAPWRTYRQPPPHLGLDSHRGDT